MEKILPKQKVYTKKPCFNSIFKKFKNGEYLTSLQHLLSTIKNQILHTSHLKSNISKKVNARAILLAISVLYSSFALADGSANLYPVGVNGKRAYLLSRSSTTPKLFNMYPSQGTMWVYVNNGETIYAGSSMQGKNYGYGSATGQIRLTSPNGNEYNSGNSQTVGLIANRVEELNGPNRNGETDGYTPFTKVADETGIWKVEFISMGDGTTISDGYTFDADANWTQDVRSGSSAMIAAWDVSVGSASDASSLIPGRVYSNIFNGTLPNTSSNFSDAYGGFFGKFYVITNNGYTYLVDNNGQIGASFGFFANNKGIQNTDGDQITSTIPYSYKNGTRAYKSKDFGSVSETTQTYVYDPREPDNGSNDITHKIFYTKPASDLPTSADIYIDGATATTWLKSSATQPEISNISLTGSENSGKVLVGPDGADITYTSNANGSCIIYIDIDNNGSIEDAVDVSLTDNSEVGTNTIHWDGKNGLGNSITESTTITLKAQVAVGEVHFPFTDVEINPKGIIIELTGGFDNNFAVLPSRDTVYWNDNGTSSSGTLSNPISTGTDEGISSNLNGHKWGTFNSDGFTDFGNNKLLDTWTYIKSDFTSTTAQIDVLDLSVNSVTPNQNFGCIGDSVTYTIEVENIATSTATADADDASFNFSAPSGFSITSYTFSVSTGTASQSNVSYSGNSFTSDLDITNGGKIIYTISGMLSAPLTGGSTITPTASIMRPADVIDIDATSDEVGAPIDPQEECDGGSSGSGCNNIKTADNITITTPVIENFETSICNGDNFLVSPADSVNVYFPIGTTFSWDVPVVTGGITGGAEGTDAINISGTLFNPTASIQTAIYSITPTSADGCDGDQFTVTVTVNPMPIPYISGASDVCLNSSVTYSTDSVAGNTYLWQVTGGTITGATTNAFVEISWGSLGTGTIYVTETNPGTGCIGVDTLEVDISEIVIDVLNEPSNITECADTMIDGVWGKYIDWSSPDFNLGCVGSGDANFMMEFNLPESKWDCWIYDGVQRIGPSTAQLYQSVSSYGSKDTCSITGPLVFIEPSIDVHMDIYAPTGEDFTWELILIDSTEHRVGSINITGDGTTKPYTINIPSSVSKGAYKFKYRFIKAKSTKILDSEVDNIYFDGILIDNGCSNEIDFSVIGPKPGFFPVTNDSTLTYKAIYRPNDTDSIIETYSFAVTVNPLPEVSVGDETVCSGTKATFETINLEADYTYQWYLNEAAISGATEYNYTTNSTFTGMNSNLYKVVVTNTTTGCQNEDSGTLTVEECCAIEVTANSNSPICEENELSLSASTTGEKGAVSFSWTGPNSFISLTQNPTVSSPETGWYYVTATDNSVNGCDDVDSVYVTVNPLPVVTLNLGDNDACIDADAITLSGGLPAGGTYSG
ncbi:PKD-like domain-containing protein, partial [Maribellus maritimus]|uniref:PKD-like domain-containing protein n=1 Tax=Maribellus maritimus TaxID=2870838 RepID=UPI001EEB9800